MDFAKVRKLIEAGFSDEDISKILNAVDKAAEKPEPAASAKPEEEKAAPAAAQDAGSLNDFTSAIKSLEMTIRASNLINSTIPTVAQNKTADDVLAKLLDPNGKEVK